MDCYFHSNVPSVAPCGECRKPICATCRDASGQCPSCRLAQKIDAAAGARQTIAGEVGPRTWANQSQQATYQQQYQQPPQPTATMTRSVAVHADEDPVESRALIALGYPLWPLALLGLLDRKQSPYLRRQTYQALGFNLGMWAFGGLLGFLAEVPWFGISAGIIVPFLIPVFLVASVLYGFKVWQGEDVRIPILTDWIDERMPAS